jgi:hypothetical protein
MVHCTLHSKTDSWTGVTRILNFLGVFILNYFLVVFCDEDKNRGLYDEWFARFAYYIHLKIDYAGFAGKNTIPEVKIEKWFRIPCFILLILQCILSGYRNINMVLLFINITQHVDISACNLSSVSVIRKFLIRILYSNNHVSWFQSQVLYSSSTIIFCNSSSLSWS